MCDRRAERRFAGRACGIGVNELIVECGPCESVDLFLGDGMPGARRALLAFQLRQPRKGSLCARGHVRPQSFRVTSWEGEAPAEPFVTQTAARRTSANSVEPEPRPPGERSGFHFPTDAVAGCRECALKNSFTAPVNLGLWNV